jgi:hypothetical protein
LEVTDGREQEGKPRSGFGWDPAGASMRLIRIILKILLVACLILVGLAVYLYLWWNEKPTISVDYVAKFNEMRKPADYRPEDDGAPLFMKACGLMEEQYDRDEAMPNVFRYVAVMKKESVAYYRRFYLQWPGDMNEVEVGQMKAWLSRSAEAMKLAEEAITKKCFWVRGQAKDGRFGNMRHFVSRDLCRVLIWRGKFKAWQGDVKGGLSDIVLAGNIPGCVGEKPTDVEWVWGVDAAKGSGFQAIEMLSRTKVSSQELAELASEIEKMGSRWDSIETPMMIERLYFLDFVQRCFSDNGHGDGRILPGVIYPWLDCLGPDFDRKLDQFMETMTICLATRGRRATVERYDRFAAESLKLLSSKLEPWQLRAAGRYPWAELKKSPVENIFLEMNIFQTMFSAPTDTIVAKLHEHRNTMSGMVATIAVLRCKVDTGALPDGWDGLVKKGYIAEPPRDIYSGKPFIYRKTGDDFTVYGVGKNCIDDGGDREKDIVFWPVETHENDPQWAVAMVAMLRYKNEVEELPSGWEDLVKRGYLKEVPVDVFSGKPLIYKRTGDKFTVYSVGEDGNDDGGDRKKDIVFWPVERVEPSNIAMPVPDANK